MEKLLKDVPDYIKELVPYPTGKPIEEVERQYGIKNSIKLASNENDFGPSPRAIKRLKGCLETLFRYPDGNGYYLKDAISRKFSCGLENIVLGNGSNEIIDFLCRVFLRPGRNAISSKPSFLVYSKMVQVTGGENRFVPLKIGTHDLESIKEHIDENTRLIFLDNPNNPMGTVMMKEDFEKFLNDIPDHLLVVLDEAYGEFVRPDVSWARGADYLKRDERIVLLKTFSKAYGLAGLRVGYGIMSQKVAALLNRVRQPFNVNLLAQEAARAALSDEFHLKETLENTWTEMARLKMKLAALGCMVLDSNTNFILVDTKRDAKAVYRALLKRGIIVRSMDSYGFSTYIRLTVGTPQENDAFLDAFTRTLDEIPES